MLLLLWVGLEQVLNSNYTDCL